MSPITSIACIICRPQRGRRLEATVNLRGLGQQGAPGPTHAPAAYTEHCRFLQKLRKIKSFASPADLFHDGSTGIPMLSGSLPELIIFPNRVAVAGG